MNKQLYDKMLETLKLIWEADALAGWAWEKGDEEESIADILRATIKMSQEAKLSEEMLSNLADELKLCESMHKVAVKERDYERQLCDDYQKKLFAVREIVNKFENDVMAALSFGDADEDDDIVHIAKEFLVQFKEEL